MLGLDSFLLIQTMSPGLYSISSFLEFSIAITCSGASPSFLSLFRTCLYYTFSPLSEPLILKQPTHSSKPHLNPISFLKAFWGLSGHKVSLFFQNPTAMVICVLCIVLFMYCFCTAVTCINASFLPKSFRSQEGRELAYWFFSLHSTGHSAGSCAQKRCSLIPVPSKMAIIKPCRTSK